VTLLTEWRDSAGLVMLEQGADLESFTDDQYAAAVAAVQQAVDAGQVRRFTGNDYTAGLANGTVHACLAWSGDIVQMQADDPQIRFVEPEAGMMIWADAMLIPQGAAHKRNAEKLTDYYYEPDVAARLAAWVQYISPVTGAREAMEKVDPRSSTTRCSSRREFLARTRTFMDVDAEQEKRYAQAWTSLMGG
jgi:spermidine/putrescine transport system substrate-binding protein